MNSIIMTKIFNGVRLASVLQANGTRIFPDTESNRMMLAETFLAASCPKMTPVMCGFLLLVMSMPTGDEGEGLHHADHCS